MKEEDEGRREGESGCQRNGPAVRRGARARPGSGLGWAGSGGLLQAGRQAGSSESTSPPSILT
jgi:hypothetical protein